MNHTSINPISNTLYNPLVDNFYLSFMEEHQLEDQKNHQEYLQKIWNTSTSNTNENFNCFFKTIEMHNIGYWHWQLLMAPKRSQFITHEKFPLCLRKNGSVFRIYKHLNLNESGYVSPDNKVIIEAGKACLWTKHSDIGLAILLRAYQDNQLTYLGLISIVNNVSLFSATLEELKARITKGTIDIFIGGGCKETEYSYQFIKKMISIYCSDQFYPRKHQIVLREDLSKHKDATLSNFKIYIKNTPYTIEAQVQYVGFDIRHQPFQLLKFN